MASKIFRRRAIVATLVVMALAASRPASAQTPPNPQDACMSQLTSCYYWAAAQAGFWTMWAGGIDCEIQMIDCIRRAVLGR
jgi:hypothetical protein